MIRYLRAALPLGWVCATIGYFGPWVEPKTSALALAGPDLAEFVKFLPTVADGSLPVIRQSFYLPVLAVVLGVALLVGSRSLHYPWLLRVALLAMSISLSLQLLPPAWSPASLSTAEFRLQPLVLAFCWLALIGHWLLERRALRWTGLLAALFSLIAGGVVGWQFARVEPAISAVYSQPLALGWGMIVCVSSLLGLAIIEIVLALRAGKQVG